MKKFKKILAFTLVFMMALSLVSQAKQSDIDYLVSTISKQVAAKKWKLVEQNIQSLEKTLQQDIGVSKLDVKVKSNPVGERLTKVQQRLNEINAEYKIFNDAYLHYLKARKIKSKEALKDISVEMVNKLSLLAGALTGGKLSPLSAAADKNAKIIAADLKTIKSLDAMGKYILVKRDSLKPAIREAQAERTELVKLNSKYLTAINKYKITDNANKIVTGWEGTWQSDFGLLTLTGTSSITGNYPHHGGKISGTVSGNTLTGTWVEDDNKGKFIFTMSADGKSFTGSWSLEDADPATTSSGSWSGTRQ